MPREPERRTPMRTRLFVACTTLALVGALSGRAAVASPPAPAELEALAKTAVEGEQAAADAAVEKLRAAGPAGLDTLLALAPADEAPRGDLSIPRALGLSPEEKARRARIFAGLDRVAGQKDARFAHLYWHTDEAEAIARATETGRPIVSLRLLGRLDEDCSCANSRFFRTSLYPDPAVSAALRDRFVLHWRSMRPVPKITIDFGDGRVLERPVTGNSAHLVLDAKGRVVDVIPGLLGPAAFLRALERAESMARATVDLQGIPRAERLGELHREALTALDDAWKADAAAIGRPDARPETLDDLPAWIAVAERHRDDARLSGQSVAVMQEKTNANTVARVTVSKTAVENPLVRMVRRFEGGIAVDTVRNEQRLHRAIHGWFVRREPMNVRFPQELAERVYTELFLTPSADPWLGLVPPDEYAALDASGTRVATTGSPAAASGGATR